MGRPGWLVSVFSIVGSLGPSLGCVPATTYSASVISSAEVSVEDPRNNVVLAPGRGPERRVVREERLPLGLDPVVEAVERHDNATVSATVTGCPEGSDNERALLVGPTGELIGTETQPSFAVPRGKLVWTYGPGDDGSSNTSLLCRYGGTLKTDVANVRWIRKTTAGRTGPGVVALIVGSLITAGGGTGLALGVNNDVPAVTAIGSAVLAVGLLTLGLGTYHVTLSPRTETVFPLP